MRERMEELMEYLTGKRATVVSALFLLISLVLRLMKTELTVDPAWAAVLISGLPLVWEAAERLLEAKGVSKISSPLLISVAMIASVAIGDIFAAGEIAFLMALGELLEDMTTDRAKRGLHKLLSLAPRQGRRVTERGEELIPAEEIRAGDLLRILPGETIPVDGSIVSGETSVDQSVMTGESLPVDKTVGDSVFCGCINRFGAIDIRADRVGEDSSLQKLICMVREAEEKQSPMQRIADRWASYLVPLAMLIAVAAGLVRQDLEVAVTILVVFCPCALVLATPTAIIAAIGQATRHGIIIKSGEALEALGKVDTVAFDKTGTLTYGTLEVSNVVPFGAGWTEDDLLVLTASAESRSEHPLGKAVTAFARKRGVEIHTVEDFRMEAGRGVSARVNGKTVLCGSESYLAANHVPLPVAAAETLDALRGQGKATILVAADGVCAGVLALNDVLRPEAAEVSEKLAKESVETVLLTGDNRRAAEYFAARAGISNLRSELLPEQKVESILQLQSGGRRVCMIGDGVNDAPALKAADVGVAMGVMGSDIAVEAADIALMSDDLSGLPYLKRLANATANTIRFSISLSLAINFLAIVLSLLKVLNPTTGALVHNAGSVLVVLIAAMLYDRKFE